MSEQVTLGFGADGLAGLLRPDAGALIYRDGAVTEGPAPRVEAVGAGAWRASGGEGLELAFEALGGAAGFADGASEWLCRVSGSVSGEPVECLGHSASEPRERKRVALDRALVAWLAEDLAVALRAHRPARAKHHEAEQTEAFVLRGAPIVPDPVEDPRLSTAYGGDGHQRRAGLELWETEESERALRLGGEALADGTLALPDGSELRAAFFVWRSDGATGWGRYDIVTPGR